MKSNGFLKLIRIEGGIRRFQKFGCCGSVERNPSLLPFAVNYVKMNLVMYRIYLVHNTSTSEMVTVWRLQTLASASGLHLDVPNQSQRQNSLLISQMIDEADAVIVLVTKTALESSFVTSEVNYARTKEKIIIPIFVKGVAPRSIQALSGNDSFIFDPQKPWEMESNLSAFLNTILRTVFLTIKSGKSLVFNFVRI